MRPRGMVVAGMRPRAGMLGAVAGAPQLRTVSQNMSAYVTQWLTMVMSAIICFSEYE